jgi:acetolactate decarboxylase
LRYQQATHNQAGKCMTKRNWIVASALIAIVVVFGSFELLRQPNAETQPTLYQVAAFNTFSEGNYAGVLSYGELERHGDFGIGTFDGLNGEMIAVNGVFYQIPSDGKPVKVNDSQTCPYATVTYFHSDQTIAVTSMNYTQLKAMLDETLASPNAIYAIKVTGSFSWAQTRSPLQQTQPYPNLTTALKNQSVFNLNDTSATAVGFWFPNSMNGTDYAGYHMHLITEDHSAGGHLLDCTISNATVELEKINNFDLWLP